MRKTAFALVFLLLAPVPVWGQQPTPPVAQTHLPGPELTTITGWWAHIYPQWAHIPEWSTVHPVARLWTPSASTDPHPLPQSFVQVRLAEEQLTQYGSGLDILEFVPNPKWGHFNALQANYFPGLASAHRPFMIAMDYMAGTDLLPMLEQADYFDMSDPYNRQRFKQYFRWTWEAIEPNLLYYVKHNERAVVYLWSTQVMKGDFGSLLEEIKSEYPVCFIGSEIVNVRLDETDPEFLGRVKAMDGFMVYSLLDPQNEGSYVRMFDTQHWSAVGFRKFLNQFEIDHPGTKRLVIATYQFAYDDRNFPGRARADGTPKVVPMYPVSRDEAISKAQTLKSYMQDGIFDQLGPAIVYSEIFEGSGVIESQSYFVPKAPYRGYGTERLEIAQIFKSLTGR